jgi:hypothetical protein
MPGAQYAEFIEDELEKEDRTLSEFRQRALTVVTTSGGLVTLAAGLIAIAAGSRKDYLPTAGRGPLAWAIVTYVLAALVALVVNVPTFKVRRATAATLQARVNGDEFWVVESESDSLRAVADKRVTTLKTLRDANRWRAKALTVAIFLEVVAIGATGLTAYRVFDAYAAKPPPPSTSTTTTSTG